MVYHFDVFAVQWLNAWVFWKPWVDALIVFCVEWLPWWVVVGLLAFGLLALLRRYAQYRRRNWEMIFVAFAAAVLARFGVTQLIRFFYNRPRPFEVLPTLRLLVRHDGGGSFPSGHATFFFAIAAVVSRYYPKTGILFYAAVILLSISRVVVGIHWPSDIVGGAAAGIAVGLLCEWAVRKYRQSKTAA